VEEYVGRLWESLPPARFPTGLISRDLERGFPIIYVAGLAFGHWCFLWPARRRWSSTVPLAWVWVAVDVIIGIGHPLWTLRYRGYTPGAATARVRLALAVYLVHQPRRGGGRSPSTERE
jgi:hypothetical protein